jgi:precorrin-6B methylase 2
VVQVQVNRSYPLAGGTALQALNPVWIVTGSWTSTGDEKSPLTPL